MTIERSEEQYAALKPRRYVAIDLERADLNPDRAEFETNVQALVAAAIGSQSPDRFRLLWKALLVHAHEAFAWSPPETAVRRVSRSVAAEPTIRHATRLLSMVHELHKAGFQRIRGVPYMAPNGMHWRCAITYSDNVREDGYGIINQRAGDGHVVTYSSSEGARYFDWSGSEALSARQLADRFLTAFPLIAERGRGRDWAYAGWWTDVLGRAEQGGEGSLLYLFADWDLEPEALLEWQPPPPLK